MKLREAIKTACVLSPSIPRPTQRLLPILNPLLTPHTLSAPKHTIRVKFIFDSFQSIVVGPEECGLPVWLVVVCFVEVCAGAYARGGLVGGEEGVFGC